MSSASAKHTLIIHHDPMISRWLSTWLSNTYVVEAVVVDGMEEFESALEALAPDVVIIACNRLSADTRGARALFAAYPDVAFIVLDDYSSALEDRLWRSLGATGCVTADTLEPLLEEVFDDDVTACSAANSTTK